MGNRIPRLKGIRYIRCQHLVDKKQDTENGAWWVGDNLRIIVCPICLKAHLGNMIDYLNALYLSGVEYNKALTEQQKEEVYKQLFNPKDRS